MRILLDTHAYVWWETDDPRLSARARGVIVSRRMTVLVSAVTAWEIANKVRIGKWPEAAILADDIETALLEESFEPLPVRLPMPVSQVPCPVGTAIRSTACSPRRR